MRISIVSPSFNQVAFIERTIQSVASQRHVDKEHIIVDGRSTDGCAEVATAAEQEYSHVRTLVEPDRGQADAINKGFHIATGDILAWLNTDDYYSDPDVLSVVVDYFDRNPDVDIAWGRGLRVNGDGSVISEAWVQRPGTDFTVALQTSLGLLQPSVFFRRSVFETVGGLSEDWPLQLDYEYWIRIAQAGFRFAFIDRILSHAVVHADAKSTAQRMQQLNECLRLVRDKFDYVPIEWIHQYGEFFLTRKDHKVSKGITLTESQADEYAAIEKALLSELNGDRRTHAMLTERGDLDPYSNTYQAMKRHGLDNPPPRRVVLTSFDSAFFQQGLNLIAALHRTSLDSFDDLFVYSLDLNEVERQRLASLEKVKVVDYPAELSEHFPEYLDPKTRAYKAYAIRSEALDLLDGDLILWMDAGLAPLQDVDAIFSILKKQEFFITNHDDKKGWPFYNVNFAHHKSHEPLQLDNYDLLGPHLCSALVGYKRGGKYQHIVDDAYRLGMIREAVVWPKVPEEKYKPDLPPEQEALRQRLASGEAAADSVSREELVSIFPYWGHRTQVIYSVLTRRAGAPVFSARVYRRSNDESSRAAAVNWSATAFQTDKASSRTNLDGVDPSVAVYHHRGIYNNLDGLRHRRDGEALFVVGNGPSLREFPFESLRHKAWLGMNAAYRYWEQVGIYPTYYSCFDEVMLDSHGVEVVKMIANREQFGIEKFFLRRSILERYPELRNDAAVYFLEDLQEDYSWFGEDRITTGSFSVLVGWLLGYRDLYILGVDLNYVERLPESVEEGRELKITTDPSSNPNYFFDGYQRKGDRFNPPNRHPGMHLRSWAQLRSMTQDFPIRITNLNPNSAVQTFPFEDYRMALKRLEANDSLSEAITANVVQICREKTYWRRQVLEQIAETDRVVAPAEADDSQSNVEEFVSPSPAVGSPKRPFYAPFGDWLKERSPRLLRVLRFARRGLRDIWRRRFWTVPLLLLIGALPFLAAHPALAGSEPLVFGAAAFLLLLFAIFYLAFRVHRLITTLSSQISALRAGLKKATKSTASVKSETRALRSDLGKLETRMESKLEKTLAQASHESKAEARALRAGLEETEKALAKAAADAQGELKDAKAELREAIEHSTAATEELEAELAEFRSKTDPIDEVRRLHQLSSMSSAYRLSSHEYPERLILLMTLERSGSTALFDLLRSHPNIYFEPLTFLWEELGMHGRRYPTNLSDSGRYAVPVEVEPGVGALVPSLARDLEIPTSKSSVAIEKAHPRFVGNDPERLKEGLARLENRGTNVDLILQVRRPLDVMWSIAEYKARQPGWYSRLAPSDIPEYVLSSIRSLGQFAVEIPNTTIIDHSDLVEISPSLIELVERIGPIDGVGTGDWIGRTLKELRVMQSKTSFAPVERGDRRPEGPDGIWTDASATIEQATKHWEESFRRTEPET